MRIRLRHRRTEQGQKRSSPLPCWMYIAGAPFEKLGFVQVPNEPLPKRTETIQHTLFSYLWSPILLFGILGGIMAYTHRKDTSGKTQVRKDHE